ncbi:hypothetical protein B0H15DRAFT_957361 [Mycena belliarum]|uniref:Uncharacterized protein n=1 Tax=Mycena belliarum TaxID=1033014 RepID=A0AAD6TQC4_9AGAR|nr:hypothetical protein B0H15DRAFT_957361 [Mycena belliae]
MTHHQDAPAPQAPPFAFSYAIVIPLMTMPMVAGVLPAFQVLPAAPITVPVPVPVPAPAPAPAVAASVAPSAPAPRTSSSAGLPAPLIALLRTEGPFRANEVYSVTPSEALVPVEEVVPAPEWYAITRGRFVGVVDQFALSAVAISGVAHSARKAYTTQSLALDAFNQALTWGGVQIA